MKSVITLINGDGDTPSGILSLQYQQRLLSELTVSVGNARKWLTYNQTIVQLGNLYGEDSNVVSEMKYRLAGDEKPVEVCSDVLSRFRGDDVELNRLYDKILNF